MISPNNSFAPFIDGPGLSITVDPGVVLLASGSTLSVSRTAVPLTANSTNYVYLDFSVGAISANTTGFAVVGGTYIYPIATAVTDNVGVKTLTDSRADVSFPVPMSPTFNDAVTGQSPSYKAVYANIDLQAGVTGALQYFKPLQGVTTVEAGANPAEVWGVYGIVNVNGSGIANAAWPVVGESNINGTGNWGIAQANSFHSAGYFHSFIASTKTVLGGVDAAVVGDINMATGRRKADCAVLASLNGAQNQSTAGAGAAFLVRNWNNQCNFDYGLDMYYSASPYANAFVVADIRLQSGAVIVGLTGAITANSTTTTLPAGSMGFTTNATGKGAWFYSDGSKWQSIA